MVSAWGIVATSSQQLRKRLPWQGAASVAETGGGQSAQHGVEAAATPAARSGARMEKVRMAATSCLARLPALDPIRMLMLISKPDSKPGFWSTGPDEVETLLWTVVISPSGHQHFIGVVNEAQKSESPGFDSRRQLRTR
jgi:hypothetical protein